MIGSGGGFFAVGFDFELIVAAEERSEIAQDSALVYAVCELGL